MDSIKQPETNIEPRKYATAREMGYVALTRGGLVNATEPSFDFSLGVALKFSYVTQIVFIWHIDIVVVL